MWKEKGRSSFQSHQKILWTREGKRLRKPTGNDTVSSCVIFLLVCRNGARRQGMKEGKKEGKKASCVIFLLVCRNGARRQGMKEGKKEGKRSSCVIFLLVCRNGARMKDDKRSYFFIFLLVCRNRSWFMTKKKKKLTPQQDRYVFFEVCGLFSLCILNK